MHLGDKMPEHRLGHFKIGNHPILHGADRLDIAGRAPKHPLGVLAHGKHPVVASGILFDCYHRGFAQNNSLAAHINTGIGCAQINGQIVRKHTKYCIQNL